MKIASRVFCIIGLVANTFLMINFMRVYPSVLVIWIILLVLSLVFSIWGIATKTKSIALGVCLILFTNVFAGFVGTAMNNAKASNVCSYWYFS